MRNNFYIFFLLSIHAQLFIFSLWITCNKKEKMSAFLLNHLKWYVVMLTTLLITGK